MSERKIPILEGYQPLRDGKKGQPTIGNLDPKNPPGSGSTKTDSSDNQGADNKS
jgi:hypothetical protein